MNLAFDVFQVVVMFVSVLLVNYLIGDGKSHWLEGKLLMCLYVIIAVCAWCKFDLFYVLTRSSLKAVCRLSSKGGVRLLTLYPAYAARNNAAHT